MANDQDDAGVGRDVKAQGRGTIRYSAEAIASIDRMDGSGAMRRAEPRGVAPYLDADEVLSRVVIDAHTRARVYAEARRILAGPPLAEAEAILDHFQHQGFLNDAAVPMRTVRGFFRRCAEDETRVADMAWALRQPLTPGVLSSGDAMRWRIGRAAFGRLRFFARQHGLRTLEHGKPADLAAKLMSSSRLAEVARVEAERLKMKPPAHRGPRRDDAGHQAAARLLKVFADIGGQGKRKLNRDTDKIEDSYGLRFIEILFNIPLYPLKKPNAERAARGQARRDPVENRNRRGGRAAQADRS